MAAGAARATSGKMRNSVKIHLFPRELFDIATFPEREDDRARREREEEEDNNR